MKRFRTSLAAKTAAVLLALAVGAGGFWSTVFILYQWDTLWLGTQYRWCKRYKRSVEMGV